MNIEELAQAVRTALNDEYVDYDPAPGLAFLENRVVEEPADPPPAHMSSWVTDWSTHAACRTTDPDELFVQGAAQNRAKAVCAGCPVRTECLADALDNRVEFGVWGGMTERERRTLLRRRPAVASWRRLLETARAEYERSTGLPPLEKGDQDGTVAEAM